MALDPVASFDCLYLGSQLQRQLTGFSRAELHLFSYLSCLLFVYRRRPASDWGYSFVGTVLGAPYSREIDAATDELEERALFLADGEKLVLTPFAQERMQHLTAMSQYATRLMCLRAACSTAIAFSVGMVREALHNEPDLRRNRQVPADRWLLDEPGLDSLYGHFEALRSVVGEQQRDLRIPALTWLTALYQSSDNDPS